MARPWWKRSDAAASEWVYLPNPLTAYSAGQNSLRPRWTAIRCSGSRVANSARAPLLAYDQRDMQRRNIQMPHCIDKFFEPKTAFNSIESRAHRLSGYVPEHSFRIAFIRDSMTDHGGKEDLRSVSRGKNATVRTMCRAFLLPLVATICHSAFSGIDPRQRLPNARRASSSTNFRPGPLVLTRPILGHGACELISAIDRT